MGFFEKYIKWVEGVFIVVLISTACYGTFFTTRLYYKHVIDTNQIAADKAVQEKLIENQKLADDLQTIRKNAEEQHAKLQLDNNSLSAVLGGVRVHLSVCRNALPKAGATGQNSDGTGGLASERADEYMADAQRQINAIAERCAQLNIDAIQRNSEVK